MRYFGQEHTVKVPIAAEGLETRLVEAVIESFQTAHHREYRFRLQAPVEVVNVHLVAYGRTDKPALRKLEPGSAGAVKGTRTVDFDLDGIHQATIYDRERLRPGTRFNGPAIVEEPATVTVVFPGQHFELDTYGNLHIHIPATA